MIMWIDGPHVWKQSGLRDLLVDVGRWSKWVCTGLYSLWMELRTFPGSIISSYLLQIEWGQYHRPRSISVNQRYCPSKNGKRAEDISHFLVECTHMQHLFLGSAAAHILLWTEQQFLLLASSMDPTLLSVSWGVCVLYICYKRHRGRAQSNATTKEVNRT